MVVPVLGLDRRLLRKKDKPGFWAVVLLKLESGDVAEVFLDEEDCPDFLVGSSLAMECDFSTYDKRLGVRVKSLEIVE